jgi:hypothetical protein
LWRRRCWRTTAGSNEVRRIMLEFALLWQCSTNYNINRRRRAWPQRAGSCPMLTVIPASRLNRPPEGAAISSLFEFPSRMDYYFCAIPKGAGKGTKGSKGKKPVGFVPLGLRRKTRALKQPASGPPANKVLVLQASAVRISSICPCADCRALGARPCLLSLSLSPSIASMSPASPSSGSRSS